MLAALQPTRLAWLTAVVILAAGCATVVPTPTALPSVTPAVTPPPATATAPATATPPGTEAPLTPSPSLQPMPALDGPGLEPGTTVVAYVNATGEAIHAGTQRKVRAGTYFDIYYACEGDARIKVTVAYTTRQSAGTPTPLTGFEGPCHAGVGSIFSGGGPDQSAFLAINVATTAQRYWVQLLVSDSAILP